MKIFIASDHGGLEQKSDLAKFISNLGGYEVIDLGPTELDLQDDYPVYAKKVADEVLKNPESKGILLCKTGVGMSIAANRFKGIYAVLCTTSVHAIRSRQHENANVICLDSEFMELEVNKELVKLFLTTEFSKEERHTRRISLIDQLSN